MRTTLSIVTAALLLAAGSARAQQASPSPANGSLDFGLRTTDVSGDPARLQRFRDIGDGAFLERARLERQGSNWFLDVTAEHVGRRDQRYTASAKAAGKLKLLFEWDQIPLFIGRDTRTLFSVASPGVLRIADDIRQGIQAGRLQLADVVGRASGLEVRSRRDTARLDLVYSATRALDLTLKLRTARRDGTMPWGASFGFNNAAEAPAPIDTRTTDLDAGVEWTNQHGMLRVGYDASSFTNHVGSLVWDSPWRFTDGPSGTVGSQGRLALWPSSHTRGVSAAGSMKLPAGSRFAANLAVGRWTQNENLLPYTINTVLINAPLQRPTAEGEAATLAMNYTFTSRPTRYVWLNARYRYYDFDNRTPPFTASGKVTMDTSQATNGHTSEPLGYTRRNLDVDAAITPAAFTSVRVGYSRAVDDRTFRIFARTTDDVVRASVDAVAARVVTLRAIVEHAVRRGSSFDEELLDEIGEQPMLRHFDVADRDRNRVTGLVQLTPAPFLGLSASASIGKDDYRNSGFGLRNNENRTYAFTADVTPRDEVTAGISYTRERYTARQNSRTAAPGVQFTDPTRDWSVDSADRVSTITSNLDLLKLVPKTEIKLAYNMSRSRAAYVYGVPARSTLAPLIQLPTVRNDLHTGTADLRYFLSQKLAIGVMYWNDRYRVDDFALGSATLDQLALPGTLFLGSVYRPYTANSGWIRLLYFW